MKKNTSNTRMNLESMKRNRINSTVEEMNGPILTFFYPLFAKKSDFGVKYYTFKMTGAFGRWSSVQKVEKQWRKALDDIFLNKKHLKRRRNRKNQ